MEEKKHRIKNDAIVQGQVIGDSPQVHQHFYGTQALSQSQPPLSLNNKSLIQQLKDLLANFNHNYSSLIEELTANADNVKDACENVKGSWSGSCFGYHSKLYYGDFEKPPKDKTFRVEWGGVNGLPQGWDERTPEEVKTKIAQLILTVRLNFGRISRIIY
jgi:hypothetical protein